MVSMCTHMCISLCTYHENKQTRAGAETEISEQFDSESDSDSEGASESHSSDEELTLSAGSVV